MSPLLARSLVGNKDIYILFAFNSYRYACVPECACVCMCVGMHTHMYIYVSIHTYSYTESFTWDFHIAVMYSVFRFNATELGEHQNL